MGDMPAPFSPGALGRLIERIRPRDDEERIHVHDLLSRMGERSFAPVILLPALILVSPLSGIPGAPTLGMLLIVTVTVQALFGRQHPWLPGFVMRRTLSARKLARALDWLARPVGFIDRTSRNRWRMLTVAPLDRLALLAILLTALPWPLLEPVPMVTTVGATAVSLFAIGLLLRDGIFVVAGFVFLGVLGATGAAIWQGLV